MGCCKSKINKILKSKQALNEYLEKESQQQKLHIILETIEKEINLIKEGVIYKQFKNRNR